MSHRSAVAPDTVTVALQPDGVTVEYTDGRQVFYNGVPEKHRGSLTTPPGKDVHMLVTDESETRGVLVYVNDRKTHDDILEATGVGRVFVDDGEQASVFPGVTVTGRGYRVEASVDFDAVEGRVFVFAEDEMGELAYELVP